MAGVALGNIDFYFAWQAWHLATWTITLHGRHGAWRHGPPLLRGRRGAWRHGPSLCVAVVALRDMDLHFVWQAWHLWHWAASGGAWFPVDAVVVAAAGVAGMALGDVDFHFAW